MADSLLEEVFTDSHRSWAREMINLQAMPAGTARAIAELYASYMDKPNDPKSRGSLRDPSFFDALQRVLGDNPYGYTASDFGVLQQNPQYRGLRMVLPQSGGSYGEIVNFEGAEEGGRIFTEGPVGEPDPNDPHSNQIPRHPPNYPGDRGGLREEVYGHLIRMGFPVYGGTGNFGGEFEPGFNPIGFGQR